MHTPTWYSTGTASVEGGSTTVTGTGTLWGDGAVNENIMVGDRFIVPSQPLIPAIPIASVTDDGELELLWPWPGTEIAGQPYIIEYVGIIERSTRANRMALERMGEISAWYDVIVETDAERIALETAGSPLRANYRVMVRAEGFIWAKQTSAYGDWIGPVAFKGDTGDKGWSAVYAVVVDGARRVEQVVSWVGGEGTAPTFGIGKYRGPMGLVDAIGDATDVRGPAGNISGVTTFWQGRITVDATLAAARAGLGIAIPTQPEAEAGLENTKFMTSLTTAQAIAAQVTQFNPADLEITVSQLALLVADNSNIALFLGPTGNRVADSFDALTYVDVAGATNLSTSVAGVLKPTTSTTTQNLGTPAAATEDFSTGYTLVDMSVALTPGDVITALGASQNAATTFYMGIYKRNSAGNFDCVSQTLLTHPGGGYANATLTAPFTVPSIGTYYVGIWTNAGVAQQRTPSGIRAFLSGAALNPGANSSGFGEGNAANFPAFRILKNPTATNLTVRSASFTAAAVPSKMKALLLVKEVDAAVAGTDYTFECGRDAGTTLAAMTLTELYTLPSGLRVVEAAETSVAAQPSGTAPRWRFKTLNNKNVELHDVYFYWS